MIRMNRSIIAEGKAQEIKDIELKKKALEIIMQHHTKRADWVFDPIALDTVNIILIEIDTITCRISEN